MDKMMKKKPKLKTFVHLKKEYIYINDKYYCIAQPYTEINSPLLLEQFFLTVGQINFGSKILFQK